jgi:predicted nucleic acid-binding protein
MSTQKYLIDTNVIIGLEDNHAVQPAFAALVNLASKHQVGIFVHEAARDDIGRDKDQSRKQISLSKLNKFQTLGKVRGLSKADLETEFGELKKPNDVVDATLLHALLIGAADFLITQDRGLHERARRHSSVLGSRVLFAADAVQILRANFEPVEPMVRYVEEVSAHTIPLQDTIFDSLREDYPGFDKWWREKCVGQHRRCWVVDDNGIAGLVVRKDETGTDTEATTKAAKILKICTFKVRPEKRGVKLGELLLKKIFWFAQLNHYDVAYVTTYDGQEALIDLLEYYGFRHTGTKDDGELIYEKHFSSKKLLIPDGQTVFDTNRKNYPRFVTGPEIRGFGVPIKESYHDTLYPDLKDQKQTDLFDALGGGTGGPKSPGNTIRKVYICRAQSRLGPPGSLLFFYKGKSINQPSQSMTAVGVFEEFSIARSTRELLRLTGGRSVYSEAQLDDF